jgi:hypothetical protein
MSNSQPGWVRELEPFLQSNTLLHTRIVLLGGNTEDLVYAGFYPPPQDLIGYLCFLFRDWDIVFYDLVEGIRTRRRGQDNARWERGEIFLEGRGHRGGERYGQMAQEMNRQAQMETPIPPPEALRRLSRLLEASTRRILVMVYPLEQIAPGHRESPYDREAIACLRAWTQNGAIQRSRNVALLVAHHLGHVAPELRGNPRCRTIEIPLPSDEERLGFLRYCASELRENQGGQLRVTRAEGALRNVFRRYNLRLLDIHRLVTQAVNENMELDTAFVRRVMSGGASLRSFYDIPGEELIGLPQKVKTLVLGQDEAVHAICNTLLPRRAGLGESDRPVGVFLLVGPTGVGKTALAKALAQLLFGSEKAMIRLDMSEYGESHTTSKLIGAPPGYVGYEEGGRLTQEVAQQPESVILLDEMEKAHPSIFNVFLQVFDDGRLTDSRTGRPVDFTGTLILMTSNAGAQEAYGQGDPQVRNDIIQKNLRITFAPEFLNRLDGILYFNSLSPQISRQIVEKELGALCASLAEGTQVQIEYTSDAVELLLRRGFDREYGARPLQRAIGELVRTPLARWMLDGSIQAGGEIRVDADGEELVFRAIQRDRKCTNKARWEARDGA